MASAIIDVKIEIAKKENKKIIKRDSFSRCSKKLIFGLVQAACLIRNKITIFQTFDHVSDSVQLLAFGENLA